MIHSQERCNQVVGCLCHLVIDGSSAMDAGRETPLNNGVSFANIVCTTVVVYIYKYNLSTDGYYSTESTGRTSLK